MPNYTPNLDLIKPLGSENFSVSHANSNADKIDAAFGDINEHLEQATDQTINVKLPPPPLIPIKGDGTDELLNFQAICDYAKNNNKSVVIPPDTNITLNGILWIPDNASITGCGVTSQLTFTSGNIRNEKGGKRGYQSATNYYTEYIPSDVGDYAINLTANVEKGSYDISVDNTNGVQVGDILYLFNGDTTTWVVLNDSNQSEKFNNPEDFPLGQAEIFTVKSKTTTSIHLDRQTLFYYPSGMPVKKLLGSKNVEFSNLKINFAANQTFGVGFEQVLDCHFDKVYFNGSGINLNQKSFRNKITNCTFVTTLNRAITFDSFASQNLIANNTIQYTTGGDTAILVMMSNSNNVTGNTVNGSGEDVSNENGITIHARSYSNTVTGNAVKGSAVSYGLYFGAFNNVISGNSSMSSKSHVTCYYASKNIISSIATYGANRDKSPGDIERGINLYGSKDVTVSDSIFEKTCYIERSKRINFKGNRVITNNIGLYILGENKDGQHIISGNKFVANTGMRIETGSPFDWNGALPIKIIDNDFDCTVDGINFGWMLYLEIIGNTFKNGNKGINIRSAAAMSTIKNNRFINCISGIDFNNSADSCASSVSDNTFTGVTTPYVSWYIGDSSVGSLTGGIYGFTIYDLSSPASTTKWIYTNLTSGVKESASWTKVTLATV